MKMPKKRTLALLLVAVLALSFVLGACNNETGGGGGQASQAAQSSANTQAQGGNTPAEEPIVVKWAALSSDDNPISILAHEFMDRIDERFPGRIEWQWFPNGALGGEREMVNAMVQGTLDAAVLGDLCLNWVDGTFPECEMTSVGFLYKSTPACYALWEDNNREVAKYFDKKAKDMGCIILAYTQVGGVDVGNRIREIRTLQDFKGLKIRHNESEYNAAYLKAMGANGVPMNGTEVYAALQQGTIDGLTMSDFNFVFNKYIEINKFHSRTHHMYNTMNLDCSVEFFNKLPADLQQGFLEVGLEIEQYCKNVMAPYMEEFIIGSIEGAGVKYSYLTEDERMALKQACVDAYYEEYRNPETTPFDPEFFAKVEKFMDEWTEEKEAEAEAAINAEYKKFLDANPGFTFHEGFTPKGEGFAYRGA